MIAFSSCRTAEADPPAAAPAPQRLRLEGRLDTGRAAELLRQLRARRGQDLVLDMGAVGFLGGACLQVLLAAFGQWQRDGVSLRAEAPPEGLASALAQLGLAAALPATGSGAGGKSE